MGYRIALIGMPNVGKTALFNRLTGSHQRVANFPGVTVEAKYGELLQDSSIEVIDYPGLYSLDSTTLDEKVSRDFLLLDWPHRTEDQIVLVLDATNLDKSLFLAIQLQELGYHFLIALNLMDEAQKRGLKLNLSLMEQKLGKKIIPVSASTGEGVTELVGAIRSIDLRHEKQVELPEKKDWYKSFRDSKKIHHIFKVIDHLLKEVTLSPLKPDRFSDRVDQYVLHPVWGALILSLLLLVMFQALFSWASPLQDGIESLFQLVSEFLAPYLTNPIFKSLVIDGIISGVGGVVVFLPQILILFLFIQFLEDVGYLGRAAFLMDGIMRKLGLPGKAIIPLLSSHACAVPGLMSTRVIENNRERLVTMMVIPLTTCSARLPVYAVLISALFPAEGFWGQNFITLPAMVMFILYLSGIFSAFFMAALFQKTLKEISPSMLLMELPPYRIPRLASIVRVLLHRGKIFLTRAGTVILAVSLVIWVLMTFPYGAPVDQSYAAMIGKFLTPVFSPLGFDWRLTTALIPSIGAREVMVSALSMVLSMENHQAIQEGVISTQLYREFGFAPLMALMVWFIFAPQCISTVATLKRETQSYRWPLVMIAYTAALAYLMAYIVHFVLT